MKNNILIAVLLLVGLLTPICGWFCFIWYRSRLRRQQQEGQIFGRINMDRAQANYEPENGAQAPRYGPYFTPRGWVRPKIADTSYMLRKPETSFVINRSPRALNQGMRSPGNQVFPRNFDAPSQTNAHNSHTPDQQPNPLSKRQQRKQRALQNKQRQHEQNQNQQGNNQNQQSQQNQKRQKNKNKNKNKNKQGQDHRTTTQREQDRQDHEFGIAEVQYDQHSNQDERNGHGDTENRNDQRSSRDARNSWEQHDTGWGNNDGYEQHQNERVNSRHASPEQYSRNPSRTRTGWHDDADKGSHHNINTRNDYAFSDTGSRGRVSPRRINSWEPEAEHHGAGSRTSSQKGNVHRHKKERKERWQIELENNEKRDRDNYQSPTRSYHEQSSRHGRSPPREGSGADWDRKSVRSVWGEGRRW